VLDERPKNVVDIFENVSKDVKREKYTPELDVIRDEYEPSLEFTLAETQRQLFEKTTEADIDMVRACFIGCHRVEDNVTLVAKKSRKSNQRKLVEEDRAELVGAN